MKNNKQTDPFSIKTRDALARLDRMVLRGEGRDRLLNFVVHNHPEARGCLAAEDRIAEDLFVQKKALVEQSINAFSAAIAPGREGEALVALGRFLVDALPMLEAASFSTLDREFTRLSYVRSALSRSAPPPSPADEARRTVTAGWNSLERDLLASELRDGETPLASFDARQATTKTGRIIDRRELRERSRPGAWTRVDQWLAQFPPLSAEES